MKKYLVIIVCFLTIACKNETANDFSNEPIDSVSNNSVLTPDTTKIVTWQRNSFSNISFLLPSYMTLQNNLSSQNKRVYINSENDQALTIDYAELDYEQRGQGISDVIDNIENFSITLTKENKVKFRDIELVDYSMSKLGNSDAILVNQASSLVNGNSNKMLLQNYFLVDQNNYYAITLSRPYYTEDNVRQSIEKIRNSFEFQSLRENNSTKPNLDESVSWLIGKLNATVINYIEYDKYYSISNPPKKYSYSNHSFKFENGNLIVNFKFETSDKYVDEQTKRNYRNAGSSVDDAKFLSKDYRVISTTFKRIVIPLKNISRCDYDSKRTSNGECDFFISTKNNDITKLDLSSGDKSYTSFFSFKYDCSEEQDLGSRIDKAIKHIGKIIPNISAKKSEPF